MLHSHDAFVKTKKETLLCCYWASQVAQLVKNPPASAGDVSSIPGSGRSPGEGNGNPLQYSCLENPKDRGAWQATVHGVAESDATELQLMHMLLFTKLRTLGFFRFPLMSFSPLGYHMAFSPCVSLVSFDLGQRPALPEF